MQKDSKKASKLSKPSKKSRATTSRITERLVIPVRKYDAEVFRMLVQFVHSGSAYITQENVSGNFYNYCSFFKYYCLTASATTVN